MTPARSVPYARNALFRGIPPQRLREEQLVSSTITFGPAEVIFDEGDPPDYCYLVATGAVQISKALPDGQQELLATILPGDFFGELALYDSLPRSARATAAVPSRLGRIDLQAFQHLRQMAPLQVASNLADRTIDRVRDINARLVSELAAAGRLSRMGTELGTVSHNLRSPLATIRNAADILAEWVEDGSHDQDDLLQFVGMIRGTAERALAQIDHLMARLRGEGGTELARVPAREILRDLRSLTAGYFGNAEIRYRDDVCAYDGDVLVDRSELVSALANLVKNAVEALPPEGGEIDVAVVSEGRSVIFSVSDTGAGMPTELLPLAFEKDFTHGKPGGTGLGLAHVQEVARRHGGNAFVESALGRGTTVRIRLPDLSAPSE